MTPAQAQVLLSMASAYDNRKPDPDAAKAWAAALDGLPFDDCRAALIAHYRDGTDWLMPGHIRARVRKMRAARIEAHGPLPSPPAGLDPDDPVAYTRWLRGVRDQVADGHPPAPERLPPVDPPRLRALLAAAATKQTDL